MNAPLSAALRAALAMAMLTTAVPYAGAEEVSKTLAADARGEVEIVNVAGTVEVSGWDRAEVKVDADLGSSVEKLEFRNDGQRTLIKVVLPRMSSGSGSSDLRIKVPQGSGLIVNTVSADQIIKDVRGMQRLQAVSGMIQTELFNEDLELKNVSGEVSVRGHNGKGTLRAQTVSGDLRLEDIGSEMELGTVTGDMQVRVAELSRARIKTTNGDLELRAASVTGDVRIEAEGINGDLRFRFRGPLNAEFDIETFNGDIDNCFGPKPRRSREYGPGNELRFKEGNGDGRVRIKALNGTVEICNR